MLELRVELVGIGFLAVASWDLLAVLLRVRSYRCQNLGPQKAMLSDSRTMALGKDRP